VTGASVTGAAVTEALGAAVTGAPGAAVTGAPVTAGATEPAGASEPAGATEAPGACEATGAGNGARGEAVSGAEMGGKVPGAHPQNGPGAVEPAGERIG
jgi:hypothetical protein